MVKVLPNQKPHMGGHIMEGLWFCLVLLLVSVQAKPQEICQNVDSSGTFLPHESDCNKFYRCVDKNPILEKCPKGLHFNPRIKMCDWPLRAHCNVNTFNRENKKDRQESKLSQLQKLSGNLYPSTPDWYSTTPEARPSTPNWETSTPNWETSTSTPSWRPSTPNWYTTTSEPQTSTPNWDTTMDVTTSTPGWETTTRESESTTESPTPIPPAPTPDSISIVVDRPATLILRGPVSIDIPKK